MIALITGIAGQDGSLLAKELIARGWTVYGTDTQPSLERLWRLEKLSIRANVTVFKANNADLDAFDRAMRVVVPTHVFLMGARSRTLDSEHSPSELMNANFINVKALADRASSFGNPWVFLPSSSEIFAQDGEPKREDSAINPSNTYGESKAKLLEYGLGMAQRGYNFCVGVLFPHESFLRSDYFLVQKLVQAFVRRSIDRNSIPVHIGNFDSIRDWSSAVSVVHAISNLAERQDLGAFIIGSGVSTSIYELVVLLADKFGWQGKFGELNGAPMFQIENQDAPLLVADDNRFHQTRSKGALADISKLLSLEPTYPVETFDQALGQMSRAGLV